MVTAFLLDANVLVGLHYEFHEAHANAQQWFENLHGRPWATCPLTEAGFVRIVSNPKFSEYPADVAEALAMVSALTRLPGHIFWPADVAFEEAIAPLRHRLFGHRQVTDAYLLGLTIKNKGRLVTLDRGIEMLAGIEFAPYVTLLV